MPHRRPPAATRDGSDPLRAALGGTRERRAGAPSNAWGCEPARARSEADSAAQRAALAVRRPNLSAARAAIRFDKWLWAARFYKTRSLAAQAIDAGQARLDGERVKPAHALREGTLVSVRRHGIVVEVVVTACSDRRGSASEAARLYRETEASAAAREQEELARRAAADAAAPRFQGRPTKRDRRRLADFLEDS